MIACLELNKKVACARSRYIITTFVSSFVELLLLLHVSLDSFLQDHLSRLLSFGDLLSLRRTCSSVRASVSASAKYKEMEARLASREMLGRMTAPTGHGRGEPAMKGCW